MTAVNQRCLQQRCTVAQNFISAVPNNIQHAIADEAMLSSMVNV